MACRTAAKKSCALHAPANANLRPFRLPRPRPVTHTMRNRTARAYTGAILMTFRTCPPPNAKRGATSEILRTSIFPLQPLHISSMALNLLTHASHLKAGDPPCSDSAIQPMERLRFPNSCRIRCRWPMSRLNSLPEALTCSPLLLPEAHNGRTAHPQAAKAFLPRPLR